MEKQLESKGIPTREVMERVSNALNKATNIPIVFALITVVCLGCSIGMFMANPELLDFSSKGILKIGIPAGLALAFLIATIVKFFMNVKSKERLAENLKETKLIMDKLDALNNEKTYTERQLDNRRAKARIDDKFAVFAGQRCICCLAVQHGRVVFYRLARCLAIDCIFQGKRHRLSIFEPVLCQEPLQYIAFLPDCDGFSCHLDRKSVV